MKGSSGLPLCAVLLAAGLIMSSGQASAQEKEQSANANGGEIEKQVAIATGVGAKLLCSSMFISGRDKDDVVNNDIIPLWPPSAVIAYDVDPENYSVTAKFGTQQRVATYRDGIGCTIDTPPSENTGPREARLEARAVVEPGPALSSAFDAAMADPNGDLRTRALVVIKDGEIVGERYADGFDKSMPLLGWSMSKSVTAALAGLVVGDGLMELDSPLGAPEWEGDADRSAITLRNLLQMSSGLEFVEEYTAGNDSVAMLFLEPDMAAYAASKPLIAEPDTLWSYSSGSTNIVSRALTNALGGSEATQAYLRKRLFGPAGMKNATFEEDNAGTPVGSSYIYATARDWARFGLLFLNQGKVGEEQILSPEWVNFIQTPAPASDQGIYGAGFWLNGKPTDGDGLSMPELPGDAYFAMGHNGQVVGIFPSQNVVIVRLGWTTGEAKFDTSGHFAEILKALD
tara:strand:+ start:30784 stop:32154 length:1371 start_codon:yes stop_codon:yes gene_type:complete